MASARINEHDVWTANRGTRDIDTGHKSDPFLDDSLGDPPNSPTSEEYVGDWGSSCFNADFILTKPTMADCGVSGLRNFSPCSWPTTTCQQTDQELGLTQ